MVCGRCAMRRLLQAPLDLTYLVNGRPAPANRQLWEAGNIWHRGLGVPCLPVPRRFRSFLRKSAKLFFFPAASAFAENALQQLRTGFSDGVLAPPLIGQPPLHRSLEHGCAIKLQLCFYLLKGVDSGSQIGDGESG